MGTGIEGVSSASERSGRGKNGSDGIGTGSTKQDGISTSTDSIRTTGSIKASSLHGNLMRHHSKRDPMSIYEVIAVLGEGSMGSVSKVRKLESALGGSARPDFVASHRHETMGCCARWITCFFPKSKPNLVQIVPSNYSSTSTTCNTNGSDTSSTGIDAAALSSSSASCPPPTTTNSKQRNYLTRTSSSMIRFGRNSKKEQHFYALKSIHLDRCMNPEFQQELQNEVNILRSLDHPHILRVMESFSYQKRLFLVLEICSGGDLYGRDPYEEKQAATIMYSLLSAVAYLHCHGIVHRDLKFENCLFEDKSPNAKVKIIDFGLSQKFAAHQHLHETVGTVYTMAPELLQGDYDAKADMWSLGVIAYMLLSSSMPFYGRDRVEMMKRIIKANPRFPGRRWRFVSMEAQLFVKNLLTKDPKQRPSADEAFKLDWMVKYSESRLLQRSSSGGGAMSSASGQDGATPNANGGTSGSSSIGNTSSDEVMDDIQASIHAFSQYTTLKKLGLMVVAYQSTSSEVGYLRDMFERYDFDHNGEISLDEFKKALMAEYDYSEDECERLFNGIDIDGTGVVHYIEYLAATIEAYGSIEEDRIAEAFDRIDSDDTGFISVKNLASFLGEDIPKEFIDRIIDEADILKDRRISYPEFLALWNNESDQLYESAKMSVKEKRCRRANSSVASSLSSASEGLTDSERNVILNLVSEERSTTHNSDMDGGGGNEDDDDKNGGEKVTGSTLYNQQKELSIRGAWI